MEKRLSQAIKYNRIKQASWVNFEENSRKYFNLGFEMISFVHLCSLKWKILNGFLTRILNEY